MEENVNTRQSSKEKIKQAWHENDIIGLIKEGIDSFLSLLSVRPVPFAEFIEEIGGQIDRRIPALEQENRAPFIAGTLTMQKEEGTALGLSAALYFKSRDGKWQVSTLRTQVSLDQIADWKTQPQLEPLLREGKVEFPIDPPKRG